MGKISYDQKLNCNHNKGQINMFMDDTKTRMQLTIEEIKQKLEEK